MARILIILFFVDGGSVFVVFVGIGIWIRVGFTVFFVFFFCEFFRLYLYILFFMKREEGCDVISVVGGVFFIRRKIFFGRGRRFSVLRLGYFLSWCLYIFLIRFGVFFIFFFE